MSVQDTATFAAAVALGATGDFSEWWLAKAGFIIVVVMVAVFMVNSNNDDDDNTNQFTSLGLGERVFTLEQTQMESD